MTLSDFASLAEVVNAAAVILTLAFLIVSIRQNTEAQLAVQSITAAIAAINVPAMETPAPAQYRRARRRRLGGVGELTAALLLEPGRTERLVAGATMGLFAGVRRFPRQQREAGVGVLRDALRAFRRAAITSLAGWFALLLAWMSSVAQRLRTRRAPRQRRCSCR